MLTEVSLDISLINKDEINPIFIWNFIMNYNRDVIHISYILEFCFVSDHT